MSASNYITQTFPVTGMSCASCSLSVETILNATNGVIDAKVNFANASVLVKWDQQVIQPAGMKTAIQAVGYDLIVEGSETAGETVEEIQRKEYDQLKKHTLEQYCSPSRLWSSPCFYLICLMQNGLN